MENEWTRIRVRKSTTEKLKRLGNKGETYDDIINRLIEGCQHASQEENQN